MAGKKRAAPSPAVSIGNCKVEIEGSNVGCASSEKKLILSVSNGAKIKISVDNSRSYRTRRSHNTLLANLKSPDTGGCLPMEDLSFSLMHPKDVGSDSKSLLQEVLKIYMEELPTMNYAANTGKESNFLERCISSGRYRTLVLRSNDINDLGEVIAAVSYQIIPNDTQYAEIPLAAVCSKYQKKGVGHLLYNELSERLQNVGILTIFCWADTESEGFWLKQGFISIGKVDCKGKARRLPIKPDIRKALCFPGGSTLMVTNLKDTVASGDSHIRLCSSDNSNAKSSKSVTRTCEVVEKRTNDVLRSTLNERTTIGNTQCPSEKDGWVADTQQIGAYGCSDGRHCSFSGETRRQVWEASVSSLKSKRIRGDHLTEHYPVLNQDFSCNSHKESNAAVGDCLLGVPSNQSTDVILQDCNALDCVGNDVQGNISGNISNNLTLKGGCPTIMFMNIADDAKKSCLTRIVEDLGGSVTCDGNAATHIITGKVRRTLNVCMALCSGAWILSPNWLKASFREGRFLGEAEFILEDNDFLLKYKSELREAVIRAKTNPCSLFRGYHICLGKHIQPSADLLSTIIKSAGGNVIRKLHSIQEPSRTIFLACEEDMGEALTAAKKGVWTYSSDWFMSCVMRQQLDMEAPQFLESL